jgi:hypothetical protein
MTRRQIHCDILRDYGLIICFTASRGITAASSLGDPLIMLYSYPIDTWTHTGSHVHHPAMVRWALKTRLQVMAPADMRKPAPSGEFAQEVLAFNADLVSSRASPSALQPRRRNCKWRSGADCGSKRIAGDVDATWARQASDTDDKSP